MSAKELKTYSDSNNLILNTLTTRTLSASSVIAARSFDFNGYNIVAVGATINLTAAQCVDGLIFCPQAVGNITINSPTAALLDAYLLSAMFITDPIGLRFQMKVYLNCTGSNSTLNCGAGTSLYGGSTIILLEPANATTGGTEYNIIYHRESNGTYTMFR